MKVTRTLNATTEAISLGEARRQCKIDDTLTDDVLRGYIEAARDHVEKYIKKPLVQSTYEFYFDGLHSSYEIYNPIVSITSFEYKTASNTGTYSGSLTGSDYHMNTGQGLITLADNAMSDLYSQSNAVKITAVTGESNIGNIRGDIKQAMLLLIGHWEKNREDVLSGTIQSEIPFGFRELLAPYRAFTL